MCHANSIGMSTRFAAQIVIIRYLSASLVVTDLTTATALDLKLMIKNSQQRSIWPAIHRPMMA